MSSDKPSGGLPPNSQKAANRPRLSSTGMWLVLLFMVLAGILYFSNEGPSRDEIPYSFFREELALKNIKEVEFVGGDELVGKFIAPPKIPTTKPV